LSSITHNSLIIASFWFEIEKILEISHIREPPQSNNRTKSESYHHFPPFEPNLTQTNS
jgi:hypothetical protein